MSGFPKATEVLDRVQRLAAGVPSGVPHVSVTEWNEKNGPVVAFNIKTDAAFTDQVRAEVIDLLSDSLHLNDPSYDYDLRLQFVIAKTGDGSMQGSFITKKREKRNEPQESTSANGSMPTQEGTVRDPSTWEQDLDEAPVPPPPPERPRRSSIGDVGTQIYTERT